MQPIGQCSDPYVHVNVRVVFRLFTPLPTGLEYQYGHSYYFICKFL
jgi:hypothetical protein